MFRKKKEIIHDKDIGPDPAKRPQVRMKMPPAPSPPTRPPVQAPEKPASPAPSRPVVKPAQAEALDGKASAQLEQIRELMTEQFGQIHRQLAGIEHRLQTLERISATLEKIAANLQDFPDQPAPGTKNQNKRTP